MLFAGCTVFVLLHTMEFCTPSQEADLVLVRISKALDFQNAETFIDGCRDHLDGPVAKILVVFEEGAVLDSAGMGAVIRVYRDLRHADEEGLLGVVNRSTHAEAVFGMTGFEDLLCTFATEERAIEAMQ